jgi:hypothetical protein
MNARVDLYGTYSNFTEQVLAAIRAETSYGNCIGFCDPAVARCLPIRL